MVKVLIRKVITLISIRGILKPVYIIPIKLRRTFKPLHKPISIDIIKVNLPSPKETSRIKSAYGASINKINISHPDAFSDTFLPEHINPGAI